MYGVALEPDDMKQRFKVFSCLDDALLEEMLNSWSEKLPPTARIRRTQLATSFCEVEDLELAQTRFTALINYEVEE